MGSAAGVGGFKERWRIHRLELCRKTHHSSKLQRAWNKYGVNAFTFEVLLYCDPENCLMYEQIALDHYKPEYNINPCAYSRLGAKHTDGSKAKMRGPRPAITGKQNPMYGKRGSACPSFGLRRSQDTKTKQAKVRSAYLGKLTTEDILQIRNLASLKYTHKEIALWFGVHRSTISRICRKETWRYT